MKLPAELLDTIADNVTETADLLSLGLTCKYLAKSIFRDKLFYHTISGSLYQPNLWHHLITNPEISRHIRRLHVTRGTPSRKMRLQVDLCKNHPYSRPENVEPFIWVNQLFARALCQMVNLKALEWCFEQTPILDANSDIGKDYPNLRILKQVSGSHHIHTSTDGSYISIFDTPILYPNSLISITIEIRSDSLDIGNSLVNLLTRSLDLKYLRLDIADQALLSDLFSLCRWPNLEILSLSIICDHGQVPKEESIIEFIGFHSNIVCLYWFLGQRSQHSHSRIAVPFLAPNSLPHLRAIDANENSIQSVILSPCIPPRPLEKIIDFPTGVEVWDHLESFENICQSTLRIVSIAAESINQLINFAVHFPNVECIDMVGSGVLRGIGNTPNEMEPIFSGLSGFKRLRVVLGIQCWEYDERGQKRTDNEFLHWIHTLFPCLEFCGVDWGGIVFTRDDNIVCNWHWVPPPPGWPSKFLGKEKDFAIREGYDRFAS